MSTAKRRRQRANREARIEAEQPIPELTDADLATFLVEVTVRPDCKHASTRDTTDGLVLVRCAAAAAQAGGCPVDCPAYERRRRPLFG